MTSLAHPKNASEDNSVGILGGGQLAQMLVEASGSLALGPVTVLEPGDGPGRGKAVCPAALAGARIETRDAQFFSRVSTVVFENEFVDCDRLAQATRALRTRFVPGLDVIRRLQNKLLQKCALHELAIATSPFERAPTGDPEAWLEWLLRERFPLGAVLKWARLGYDGKGVFVLRPGDRQERARVFCREAASRGIELFAEEWVDFRRELAVVACRSEDGRFAAYPLVESEQRDGVCLWVRGKLGSLPLAREGLLRKSDDLEHEAHALARKFGEGVGLVGAFALELFETRDGRLLVNEIAPRVHNSAHYTQDAADTSQFENHLRAVLGLELGSVRSRPAFAMLNLLGPAGLTLELDPVWRPRVDADCGLFLHWYGKTSVRPGRKLGHVNARADEPGALPELIARLEAWSQEWEASLRAVQK